MISRSFTVRITYREFHKNDLRDGAIFYYFTEQITSKHFKYDGDTGHDGNGVKPPHSCFQDIDGGIAFPTEPASFPSNIIH